MKHQDLVILHLSFINGIGPAAIQTIVSSKPTKYSWDDLYTLSHGEWVHEFNLSAGTASKIIAGLADTARLDEELELIERHNVSWATCVSDAYPSLLKHIHLPPPVLYWQGGQFDDTQKRIAVVGSRNAHHYGERVINNIIPKLIAHGWVIVSGGAIGADSMAHRAALQAKGKTVVVLGSGLLSSYPLSNVRLFETIVNQGGMLVSSFSLTQQALSGNFPKRNRIISGLSHGCLIVQAAQKSGARITAQFALDQGREVFAVPGLIDDELSLGCHALIQEGAKLVSSADDILQEFGYITLKKEDRQQQQEIMLKSATPKLATNETITDAQLSILQLCRQPSSIDVLLRSTNINLIELQMELFNLQLAGKIQQDFTGMWLTK